MIDGTSVARRLPFGARLMRMLGRRGVRRGQLWGVYEAFVISRIAVLGLLLVLAAAILAIFAPWIAPYDPGELVAMRLQKPGAEFWLGTDHLGRDVFSRIVWGARVSMIVGVAAQAISALVGVSLGLVSGYYGGRTDNIIMRTVDVFMSFPYILLALLIVASLGAGTGNVIIALGFTGWPGVCRIARVQALALRNETFVQALKSMGCSDRRIILRHILPNSLAPVLVVVTLGMAYTIIGESSLSFLGLGVKPPTPSWGIMLADARPYMRLAPLLSICPGVSILLTVLGFNLVGDGLRDALDPRLKTSELG